MRKPKPFMVKLPTGGKSEGAWCVSDGGRWVYTDFVGYEISDLREVEGLIAYLQKAAEWIREGAEQS